MKYFFTTFGDVYAGVEDTDSIPDFTIVIPMANLREYSSIPKNTNLTKQDIDHLSWVIPTSSVAMVKDECEIPNSQIKNPFVKGLNPKLKHDTMFIFGAGASANCVFGQDSHIFKKKDPLWPPLGTELFEKRFKVFYESYSGVKLELSRLQKESCKDVEELFQREWEFIENNNIEVMRKHLNIQYYIQQVLLNVSKNTIEKYYSSNLYCSLGARLQEEHHNSKKSFALVSFNQDYIMEHFVSRCFGMNLKDVSDYVDVEYSPAYFFKPHGSSDWGWLFPPFRIIGRPVHEKIFEQRMTYFDVYKNLAKDTTDIYDWNSFGLSTQISNHGKGRITINKSKIVKTSNSNPDQVFPALLIPYRDKDDFLMPADHFHHMRSYIESMETLVIIGWKGNEDAFNKQLQRASNLKRLFIVDIDCQSVENRLPENIKKAPIKIKHFNRGFEDFILNHLDEVF